MLEELKNLGNRFFFFFSDITLEQWRHKSHPSIQNHFENEREWKTGFQHLLGNKRKKTELSGLLKMSFQRQQKARVVSSEPRERQRPEARTPQAWLGHSVAAQCAFSALFTEALTVFPGNFQRSGWEKAR